MFSSPVSGSAAVAFSLIVGGLLGGLLTALVNRQRLRERARAWPRQWGISARPVFATHERAMHRLLAATLPQHVVLAKLPLLRFCQAVAPADVSYWYELLGPLYVSFAICSANGRVLVAVDFDSDAADARAMKLKSSALQACRIRHVKCRPNVAPSRAEILSWVGELGSASRPASNETAGLERAGAQLAQTVRKRRAERAMQWQDSFFAPDSRFDDLLSGVSMLDEQTTAASELGPTTAPRAAASTQSPAGAESAAPSLNPPSTAH